MLDTLKGLWSKWKVQVTVVGGALVVATAYGTCVYEPTQDDSQEVSAEPASNTEATTTEATTTEATATETTTTESEVTSD